MSNVESAYKLREAIRNRKPFEGVANADRLLLTVMEYGQPMPHGKLENKCRSFLRGADFERELMNQVAAGHLLWKQSGPRGGIRYECAPSAYGIAHRAKLKSLEA